MAEPSRVSFLAPVIGERVAMLIFDYGIVELGTPVGVEQKVRELLIEAGLAPFTDWRHVPHARREVRIVGTVASVAWFPGQPPDQYEEIPPEWIAVARRERAVLFAYRNLTPRGAISLAEAVEGALVGYVSVAAL